MKTIVALTIFALGVQAQTAARDWFDWSTLPSLPHAFSGQFAGVSGDALIVVGGSYFPVSLFEGGRKQWTDAIFVLEPEATQWRTLQAERAIAYGGSVTANNSLILMGGGDANENFRNVVQLRWRNSRLERTRLPLLPRSVANTSAALLGSTIYVAGGQEQPTSTISLHNFWALDLTNPAAGWKQLDPWPGPSRIFPVLAAQDGAVYLFSGAELYAGPDGKAARRYLTDAYRYVPGQSWKKLTDTPSPIVAAPAIAYGQSHILAFGGDDGANAARAQELKDNHPGFSRSILAYHTITGTWTRVGTLPNGLVTTTAVQWRDAIVIPGGEDRPAHRSSDVLAAHPSSARARFGFLDYSVLSVYLLGIVLMGAWFTSRNRSTGDFMLGGRRVPWWAAGLSIYGTQLSSITFMAIPAKAYASDWSYILVNACILIVTPVIVLFYVPFFHRLNVTTAYEYLEKRFNVVVRLFSSALFVIFQLARLAIVIFLPAIALATVSDVNVYLCIVLMGLLAVVYTVLGGIEAVIWTDVVQSILLLGGATVCLVLAVSGVDGGLPRAISIAVDEGKLRVFDWSWDFTTATVWVLLIGNIASVLATYTTDQTVIQKYLTTSTVKRAANSIWTNALLSIPSTFLFFGMGTALYVFYQSHPSRLNPTLPTDAIFPWFMVQQLPAGVAGLVLAALFAAAQSTISSSMHSMSTALVVDFYARFRPLSTDRSRLPLARALTCILGVFGTGVALLMATFEIRSLFDVFLTVLSLLGGSMAGIFALGIFTTRANGPGALIGGLASAILVFLVRSFTPLSFFLYAAIGLAACFVLGYLASLLLPGRPRDLSGFTVFTPSHDEPVVGRASSPAA
jgi:SSS family transporter